MRFRSLFSSLAPIALLGVGLLLTSQASAAPGVVHYHGYLTDTLGDPIDCPSADVCPSGPVSLTFRLYAEPAGGEPVWEETLESASVKDGRLNLLLGKSNPITASALSQEAWLGLSVGDAGELTPRQFLAAVPFAVRAALAQDSAALGGIPAGAYVKTADIPGLCVTEDALTSLLSEAAYLDEEALMDWLQAQGYEPGLHFSGDWAELTGVPEDLQDGDADALGGLDCAPGSVAVYDQASWACGADLVLTEDDVDAMVANNGYVLSDLLAQVAITGSYGDLSEIPAALDQLTLTQDGSLTFGDAIIINAAGEWVGSPTGLVGPKGDPGTDGVSVVSAGVDEAGVLTVTLSDGTIYESPSLMGPTGPKGDAGQDGDDGIAGASGQDGTPGQDGAPGADGLPAANALVLTTDEPAGPSCASGGIRVTSGTDLDASGTLEALEVQSVAYVCNGADGENGIADGALALPTSTDPPELCTSAIAGSQYFDTTINSTRTCDGTYWAASSAACGNGVVGAGEECDDGYNVDGDGCQANCLIAENSTCVGNCSSIGTHEAYLPTKLIADDGAAEDYFGGSASISGDTLVVGAHLDDDNGPSSGSAYVYVRSGGVWTQQQKLIASDGAAEDQFGYNVSISGDTLVVGAWLDDDKDLQSGSVYVYVRSGGVWTEQQKLTADDGTAYDYFGRSASISGDTLVVGADGDDDKGLYSGSAYVYVRSGGVWTQQQKLIASDGAAEDYFGRRVSISGDTLVVGAWLDDDKGVQSGSVYVYVRSGGAWTEQQKLTADDGTGEERFGGGVSISGDTLVVGAGNDNDNGSSSGSAYAYLRSGGVWTQQQKLTASDADGSDYFGANVSVSGDTLVVSAYYDEDKGLGSGSAYVYVRSDGVWTEQQKLTPSGGAYQVSFGWSVSISGDTLVVGAYLDDEKAETNSGSAYVQTLLTLCTQQGTCICESGYGGTDCGTVL